MDLAVRHYIPGRIRLHVPELCRKPGLTEAALVWLRARNSMTWPSRTSVVIAAAASKYTSGYPPILRSEAGKIPGAARPQNTPKPEDPRHINGLCTIGQFCPKRLD